MITLCVSNGEKTMNIEFDENENVLSFKKHVIKEFGLKTKYIDLDFKIEAPIREMGKFNLEKGVLLRTFDHFKLNNWSFKDRDINCTLIEVDDYEIGSVKPFKKKMSSNTYRPPSKSGDIKSGESYIVEDTFSLESNDDFPPL